MGESTVAVRSICSGSSAGLTTEVLFVVPRAVLFPLLLLSQSCLHLQYDYKVFVNSFLDLLRTFFDVVYYTMGLTSARLLVPDGKFRRRRCPRH